MAKLEIKAVKQTSVVTEKDQYYLLIGEDENRVNISVGEKTYTGVKNLIEPTEKKPKEKGNA